MVWIGKGKVIMTRERGFTLLETMITIALLSVVFILATMGIVNFRRAAAREEAVLQMDHDATRIIETLKQTFRAAYIPVSESPLDMGRESALQPTNFNTNVSRWRSVLRSGSDMFVFLVGLDVRGNGSFVYGNSPETIRLALGIDITGSPSDYREATDINDTLSNLGIIDLNPLANLGLSSNDTPIDVTSARFAPQFVFPNPGGGRSQIYGVVRFVPYRENNQVVTINEATMGVAGIDLNENGILTDTFVLGRLEMVYPTNDSGGIMAMPISGNTVLLQTNTSQDPLFQLVETHSTKGSTFRIKLVMFNFLEQQNNSYAFRDVGAHSYITRVYETRLKTQLMIPD